jgi:predicted dehydrogenase
MEIPAPKLFIPLQLPGSHVVDLIHFLSEASVRRVYSVSRSVALKAVGIDTADFFQSILELSTGGTAVVENCWIFVDCVVNDKPPMVSGEDGLAVARVLAALEQSARTGLPVPVA